MRDAAAVDMALRPRHRRAAVEEAIRNFDEPIEIARLAVTAQAGTAADVGRAVRAVRRLIPEPVELQTGAQIPRALFVALIRVIGFDPRALARVVAMNPFQRN